MMKMHHANLSYNNGRRSRTRKGALVTGVYTCFIIIIVETISKSLSKNKRAILVHKQ